MINVSGYSEDALQSFRLPDAVPLELPTTVVLKHIDCANKYLQERMINIIQTKALLRLGDDKIRQIRCRMLFVFQKPPSILHDEGRLIPPLFKIISKYQIIALPPLKKRKEDIPELAQHFFTQFQIKRRKQMDQNFIKLLLCNRWNENILELKSFIKTLQVPPDEVSIQQKDRIELAKINLMIDEGKEFSLKDSFTKLENLIINQVLDKNSGCRSKTAQSIGLTNRAIRYILNSH